MINEADSTLAEVKRGHASDSRSKCLEHYDERGPIYDRQQKTLGTNLALRTAQLIAKLTKDVEVREILDVGAGTCLCEEILRKDVLYKGEIDAIDGSIEMLYQASKKPINLRTIIRHCVTDQLPVRDCSYDVVICVGSFLPNYIPVTALPGILNAVRPGGLLIFNLREKTKKEYDESFDMMVSKLIKEEKMKHMTTERFLLFEHTNEKYYTDLFAYKRL